MDLTSAIRHRRFRCPNTGRETLRQGLSGQEVAALRGGRSMMVFPEGTRSGTEEMLPFRRGVFVMAIRAGVSVVPVTLLGTRQIMRKGDPRIHPGDVRMVLHDPIPTAGLSEQQRFSLVQCVRSAIASALDKG